jgi:hypothetical protein
MIELIPIQQFYEIEKTRQEVLRGDFAADYMIQILMFLIALYVSYRMFRFWRRSSGGTTQQMTRYVFVGSVFIVLSFVFEFAVVIYSQPWTFAKQWSVGAFIVGWALVFYGVVVMLRSMGVLPSTEKTVR